ncbi:MAG: peptidoglycan DD-metalloendopeptidase family protein [Casimicrobiaceae bacterium]
MAVTAPAPAPAPALSPPPASDADARPPTYTVKRGDTLYQIALDHGLDYKEFAAWNGLENPNLIRIGQVLRVTAPGDMSATTSSGVVTTPLKTTAPVTAASPGAATAPAAPSSVVSSSRNADNYKSAPKAIKEPYSEQAMRDVARSAQETPEPVASVAPATSPKPEAPRAGAPAAATEADDEDKLDWAWPAKGKIVVAFSETANLKGIDIAGTAGDPVIATAAGKVVYVGNGLRGYGKLVIVKHNKTWLSAYAHNREILVKEGQQVTRGQRIAEMGNTDADQVKLHFEIRRLGKPVDPARYLPPA